jgi:2-isopropylmalate synthase
LATSDIHLKYKLRISREQCLEQARESVRLAKSFCNDVEFSPEDATRTDREFLCQVVQAVVDAGATTVNIPDTVGYTMPTEFGEIIRMLRERVRGIENVVISSHCHNDLGLAVANSLAAIEAGARQVECTINGIGERAGNASLEEIVMAMRVRPDRYAYDTGVASEQLFPSSQILSEVTGVPVQPNKAIIGRNAFAHEAGIHQDGVLKNPLTYEIMTPQSVGVPDSRLVLGKHSGRHALSLRCEQLGYHFERRELDDIYRKFVVLADQIKHVEDHHLLQLIREARPVAQRIPPAHVEAMPPAAIAAVVGQSYHVPAPVERHPLEITLHSAHEHHGEQEDYLWGV